MLGNRRYSSAPFAAEQNMTLPSPAFARPEPSKRHSSFNLPAINMGGIWDPDRPTTSDSTRSFSLPRFPTFDGRRLSFQSDGPAVKPSKLQPSPSALQQSTLAPGSSGSTAPKADNKRRSRLFGKSKDRAHVTRSPPAWMLVAGQEHRIAFDVDAMLAGEQVSALWDESGDCFVHIFAESENKGPSFRVHSSVFSDSSTLCMLAFGQLYSDRNSRVPSRALSNSSDGATSRSSDESHETHLYLDIELNHRPAPPLQRNEAETPISDDQQTMVDIRNLFGFLCGTQLVASQRRFTLFSVFMRIADMLQSYDFSNLDSSTFGEAAVSSFDNYTIRLNLADVRRTTAKAVEMLVLSEKMRSVKLYSEAFTHVVGKHEECQLVAPNTYSMISDTSRTRLSRAAMDLEKRIANASHTCADFDMPSIFAGMMSSKTSDERRHVDFDAWKSSFLATRKFVLKWYKGRFGSWPPKPNAKKNHLRTPGLSRVVLLDLYNDLGGVYDMLVDRTNLTNRTADGVLVEDRAADPPRTRALRHILSEWDRHSPPVKPPMPFDLPLMPSINALRSDRCRAGPKDLVKKVKSDELLKVLSSAQNPTTRFPPFLQAFRDFERSQAKGRNFHEIEDLRCGQWIFIYAVLQALPMLVVDAPGLLFTEGVEYFLCEASRGGVPWARDVTSSVLQWYGIAGGTGVVSLPSDVLENSIDAIYRRSHCWQMAELWSADDPLLAAAVHEQQQANNSLPPPPELTGDACSIRRRSPRIDSRSSSPARSKRESVFNLGLEVLPIPRGISPSPDRRLVSASSERSASSFHVSDPNKTFDSILAGHGKEKK